MKRYYSMKQKARFIFLLFITIVTGLVVSVTFYLYDNLYLEAEARFLEEQITALHALYTDDTMEAFEERLEWTTASTPMEGIVSDDPMMLGAAIPLENPEEELIINQLERNQLLNGNVITILRDHENIDARILGKVAPVMEDGYLHSVILLYRPVEEIQTAFFQILPFVVIIGLLFILFLFIIMNRVQKDFISLIIALETAAKELAKGKFDTPIELDVENELSDLAVSFRQLANALDTEDEKKRAFIQNISHELRTPLSYIQGYSELLENQCREQSANSEYAVIIHREAHRMNRLVNQLIDLTKLEKVERTELSFSPLVLSEIIEEAARNTKLKRSDKEQSLTLNLDDGLIVNGIEDRLLQIFINLLDNASSYTGSGGHITVSAIEKIGMASITVEDNGQGIPKEQIPFLTERFFRVEKSRTREKGGVGIGLSIVKQIVELHDGDIHFESEEGTGTAVTIDIPLLDA
ncbi:sensor histidine kinase [Salisediminibacterium selenitireducens]|uniref:histidine kinase n=1 Tax=Bacillus selenitireducens (strain ATCC 700615 / DSM 15326 / MLS10) TaxID=439292 RepID=D6Y149_BACIE|nr:HAMP domain-containing sensor histidine kinase [Salisediminibacterium selenitireducens]ADH98653.1 integral membrane sensor signal transduction histidine kinase [[Bacillus] selenitireducens MLS10]